MRDRARQPNATIPPSQSQITIGLTNTMKLALPSCSQPASTTYRSSSGRGADADAGARLALEAAVEPLVGDDRAEQLAALLDRKLRLDDPDARLWRSSQAVEGQAVLADRRPTRQG